MQRVALLGNNNAELEPPHHKPDQKPAAMKALRRFPCKALGPALPRFEFTLSWRGRYAIGWRAGTGIGTEARVPLWSWSRAVRVAGLPRR